ncbi:MAG: hypothetical protein EA349_09670 [Halomonadaceae bacterium]|nr:MAG: hypothetical protein EA349_09670 [Halomonadaceae bacterium]
MVQQQLNRSLQQVNELKQKLQTQVNNQWSKANDEIRRILTELGADVSDTSNLGDIVSQIREQNPSFRQLMLKLDAATYDVRQKARWDAHMMSAYVWQKAETSYQRDLKPLVSNYREIAETRLQALISQAQNLRQKVASEDSNTSA